MLHGPHSVRGQTSSRLGGICVLLCARSSDGLPALLLPAAPAKATAATAAAADAAAAHYGFAQVEAVALYRLLRVLQPCPLVLR